MDPAELHKEVLRVARRYRGSTNQVVSYEDVAQDIWVKILANKELDDILSDDPEFRAKVLEVRASQVTSSVITEERYWSENRYYYSPSTIREGLENGFGCSSIQTHYAKAFKMLEHSYPGHALALTKKYVTQEKISTTERKHVQRAVDRITEYMNDFYESENRSYQGPGSRKVVSNVTGRMRSSGSWNKNEYTEDGA